MSLNCPYCGNNPVSSHFFNWYFESINVLFTPLRQLLISNFFSRFLQVVTYKINLTFHLTRLGVVLGIISFQTDRQKCKVPRAGVLWEEAEKRGIKMKELLLFGWPFDVYIAENRINPPPPRLRRTYSRKIGKSENTIIFSGLPRPFNADGRKLDVMDDKAILKQRFLKAGLPVPSGGSVWNFSQALKIFNRIQKPVIVKPRAGSRGRHSTTFVKSEADLKQAYNIAKQLCFWVVVEEQLMGPVYRATLINYELCGVLRGDPPQVVGDGINSVKRLIDFKNQKPHPGVKDVVIDAAMELFLLRQGLKLTSIPEKGVIVNLSEKIGVNYGGSSSEDLEICHPDNKELFIKAAKEAGDPVVGFDFIIPDITESWREQKSGFLEANSLPFINLHHDPLLGKPRNVAAKVWDMMGF